jgi:hypothetical protein
MAGQVARERIATMPVPQPVEHSVFCSPTVTRHVLRGAAGFLLAIWALSYAPLHPILATGAGVLALVAWRGCPMCWTVGLFETVITSR